MKRLKIIIGNRRYKKEGEAFLTSELKESSCYEFYRYFETVAFVPNKKTPFKHAFDNILNLLFFNRVCENHSKTEYTKILETKDSIIDFINCLYTNHKIVLINQDELIEYKKLINANVLVNNIDSLDYSKLINKKALEETNKKLKYLTNAEAILICGNDAKRNIKKLFNNSLKNVYESVHPSHQSSTQDNENYIDDWIDVKTDYKNNGNGNHKIKEHFMIKPEN